MGKPARVLTEPYDPLEETVEGIQERAASAAADLKERRSHLWEQLARTAALRGWNVHRAAEAEEALDYICNVAASAEARTVVRSKQEIFDLAPIDAALNAKGVHVTVMAKNEDVSQEELRNCAASAGVGITGVDYAVAETGSVVLIPRQGVAPLGVFGSSHPCGDRPAPAMWWQPWMMSFCSGGWLTTKATGIWGPISTSSPDPAEPRI